MQYLDLTHDDIVETAPAQPGYFAVELAGWNPDDRFTRFYPDGIPPESDPALDPIVAWARTRDGDVIPVRPLQERFTWPDGVLLPDGRLWDGEWLHESLDAWCASCRASQAAERQRKAAAHRREEAKQLEGLV
jgi:hypothetical protein